MRKLLSRLGLLLFLFSCSTNPPRRHYLFQKIKDSSYRGLLFTAHRKYESSTLYWYDFKTGNVEEIVSGQGGDPKLFLVGEKIYLFNRLKNRLSYLILDSKNNFQIIKEEESSHLAIGDPHSLLILSEEEVLISCPTEHKIKLFNLNSGELKDLYPEIENENFSPGSLILKNTKGVQSLYTLSLGMTALAEPNNEEKIYRFQLKTDPEIGLELKETLQSHASYANTLQEDPNISETFYSFSLAYGKGNVSYDKFTLDPFQVKQLSNLRALSDYTRMGSPLLLQDEKILAPLKPKDAPGEISILSFSPSFSKEVLYQGSSETTEFRAIYDTSNQGLILGEKIKNQDGKIHFFRGNQKIFSESFELDFYEGVLLP